MSDSRNCVFSVIEERAGALWVGTNNGLNRYDRASGRFTAYQHDSSAPHSLSRNNVLSVYQDRSGVLWAGIEFGGVNKLAAGAGWSARRYSENNELGTFLAVAAGLLVFGLRAALAD